jgi:hypothetical protein
MIYDLDFGICGQSDEVEIKDDYIIVRDHKTDKEIEFKALQVNLQNQKCYWSIISS